MPAVSSMAAQPPLGMSGDGRVAGLFDITFLTRKYACLTKSPVKSGIATRVSQCAFRCVSGELCQQNREHDEGADD